jgi:transposase
LAPHERRELKKMAASRTMKAGEVRRARVILRLGAGQSYRTISQREGCGQDFVARWKERFSKERLAGLYARHRGKIVSEKIIGQEARILKATKQAPPDGSTHWSTRKLARHLGVSHSRVARVWARAGIQPHRLRRYMASTDPDFEHKAADIIGLYLKPPLNAAVFCVDEKGAIQALDRLDPVLPLSPGRAERHGFEYYRHGTLSLYAALNTKSGEIIGQTSARHTSAEFVAFLEDVVARQPPQQAIHIICDNLSAHKTKAVWDFLAHHPKVRIHYTPTYSSWLNQVEIWFSKIQRDLLARGIFGSLKDLDRKIMRYIRAYNRKAIPIKWSYKDASNRIKPALEISDTLP